MKKAQGLSINTIIIAAIALIVLILIILIFTGNIRNVNLTANQCSTNGGFCELENLCGDDPFEKELSRYSSSCGDPSQSPGGGTQNRVCCIKT